MTLIFNRIELEQSFLRQQQRRMYEQIEKAGGMKLFILWHNTSWLCKKPFCWQRKEIKSQFCTDHLMQHKAKIANVLCNDY